MKKLSKAIDEIAHKSRPKNLSTEFQTYGVYLAESLDDTAHYSLYMRLAKQYDRNMLEEALNFTKDFNKAKSKGRVFMWKLEQIKKLKNKENDKLQ